MLNFVHIFYGRGGGGIQKSFVRNEPFLSKINFTENARSSHRLYRTSERFAKVGFTFFSIKIDYLTEKIKILVQSE